jgi:hypothetical protein
MGSLLVDGFFSKYGSLDYIGFLMGIVTLAAMGSLSRLTIATNNWVTLFHRLASDGVLLSGTDPLSPLGYSASFGTLLRVGILNILGTLADLWVSGIILAHSWSMGFCTTLARYVFLGCLTTYGSLK